MKSNLKKLSNVDLDQNLKLLVSKERELLSEIILHIVEVDIRKLYLKYAYTNLFSYLTEHIGYSAGSAQRRIDAARLSQELPEVIQKLESGSLSFTQVSLVQKNIRKSKSQNGSTYKPLDIETKKKLIQTLENKSFQESEILIHQTLQIKPLSDPKISYQQDESVRLEVTFTKSQWQKLTKMRELLSHSLPQGGWDQVFEYVSDKVIMQKDKMASDRSQNHKSRRPSGNDNDENVKSIIPFVVETSKNRSYIPLDIQRYVYKKDKCCQYVDKLSGKKCTATWQLQIDHIQPVWSGGSNSSNNLRLLCANHNRQNYWNQTNTRRQN